MGFLFNMYNMMNKFLLNFSQSSLRNIFSFWAFLILFLFTAQSSFAQVSTTQDLSVVTYGVSGNRDRSFFPKDQTRYLYEGTVTFDKEVSGSSGTKEWLGDIVYRSTDDVLVDPYDFTLQHMSLERRTKQMNVVAGDFVGYLSDYSVNNALKGAKVEWNHASTPTKIIFLSGVDASSWNGLLNERKDDGSIKRRYVRGGRYETAFADKKIIWGMNYGGASDDRAYFTATEIYKDINVVSTDFRYQFSNALLLRGDLAGSSREAHTGEGIVYDPKRDKAYRLGIDINKGKYTGSWEYSSVGPHFETTGGFATQDLESLRGSNTFFLTPMLSLSPYLYLTRDNLKNLKSARSNQVNPGTLITWSLPWSLSLTAGGDFRKQYSDDKSISNNTDTWTLGLSRSFNLVTVGLNYAQAYVRDHVNPDQERDRDSLGLNFNGQFNLGKTGVSWDMGEIVGLEKNLVAGKRDLLLMHSAGARFNLPTGLNFGGRASITDNNYYMNTNDANLWQYTAFISKEIGRVFVYSLEYLRNNNNFNDPNNDYCEQKITAKISCHF